jgi:hypothetical protein
VSLRLVIILLWMRYFPIELLLSCLVACSNSLLVIWELRALGSLDFIPLLMLSFSLGSSGMSFFVVVSDGEYTCFFFG